MLYFQSVVRNLNIEHLRLDSRGHWDVDCQVGKVLRPDVVIQATSIARGYTGQDRNECSSGSSSFDSTNTLSSWVVVIVAVVVVG